MILKDTDLELCGRSRIAWWTSQSVTWWCYIRYAMLSQYKCWCETVPQRLRWQKWYFIQCILQVTFVDNKNTFHDRLRKFWQPQMCKRLLIMSGQTWEKTWCNNSMSLHVCVKYETDAEGGGGLQRHKLHPLRLWWPTSIIPAKPLHNRDILFSTFYSFS